MWDVPVSKVDMGTIWADAVCHDLSCEGEVRAWQVVVDRTGTHPEGLGGKTTLATGMAAVEVNVANEGEVRGQCRNGGCGLLGSRWC